MPAVLHLQGSAHDVDRFHGVAKKRGLVDEYLMDVASARATAV